MIDKTNKGLSVRGLLDLNRSSLYYQQTLLAEDTEIANKIGEIYESTPQYGCRRIHAQLIREGVTVNRKKVQRLMLELGLKAIYPKPKTTILDQQSKSYPYLLSELTIERPHQVWQVDITYLRLPGGFVYLKMCIAEPSWDGGSRIPCAKRLVWRPWKIASGAMVRLQLSTRIRGLNLQVSCGKTYVFPIR